MSIQSQTEGYDDPSSLMGDDSEKELSRAVKTKGRPWVDSVRSNPLYVQLSEDAHIRFIDETEILGSGSCSWYCGRS